MSAIGPDLPPHLIAKRKRRQDEETEATRSTDAGAKRAASPDEPEKRRRVIGPAMPPAPLDQRPTEPPHATEEDSDDSDDDFGPAPPTTNDASAADDDAAAAAAAATRSIGDNPGEDKPKRDEWMMMPPEQDDLAARMDPLKQRPRTFNIGKGARAPNPSSEDHSIWHETAAQKQKRLRDEMMGIASTPATASGRIDQAKALKTAKDEAKHRKVQEHHSQARGPSLLEQHKISKGDEVEDDPSKRAFDREKDLGLGGRISTSQKKELLTRAAGFSSKFSGGSYL